MRDSPEEAHYVVTTVEGLESDLDFDLVVDAIMIEEAGGPEGNEPFAITRWTPEFGTVPCHDVDPELFDPKSSNQLKAAVKVCAACPLASRCEAIAEMNGECGVWGGKYFRWGMYTSSPRFKTAREEQV